MCAFTDQISSAWFGHKVNALQQYLLSLSVISKKKKKIELH